MDQSTKASKAANKSTPRSQFGAGEYSRALHQLTGFPTVANKGSRYHPVGEQRNQAQIEELGSLLMGETTPVTIYTQSNATECPTLPPNTHLSMWTHNMEGHPSLDANFTMSDYNLVFYH